MANQTAQEKNKIDAMSVAGQNQERQSTIANQQFALNQAQQLAKIQEMYTSEQDPAKRKILERQLYALGGKQQPKQQIVTRDIYDDAGVKTGQEFLSMNEDGQLEPVQVGGKSAAQPGKIDLPRDVGQRQVGKVYMTAKGPALWDGKGLILQQ